MIDAPQFELRYFHQLEKLSRQLKQSRDVLKVTRAALRAGLELLGASEGCVALLGPSQRRVELLFSVPREAKWDGAAQLVHPRRRRPDSGEPRAGPDPAARPYVGCPGGAVAAGAFGWQHRDALSSIAALANEALARIDQERIREVRARIDYKIMEQLRPKDLFYQLLHGLHSLTQYDHSASLLIYNPGTDLLEVVAETITWKKGKSDKIGLKLPLGTTLLGLLEPGVVYGFDRPADAWQEWTTNSAVGLAELLDINSSDAASGDLPLDRSMLCAPWPRGSGCWGCSRSLPSTPVCLGHTKPSWSRNFFRTLPSPYKTPSVPNRWSKTSFRPSENTPWPTSPAASPMTSTMPSGRFSPWFSRFGRS